MIRPPPILLARAHLLQQPVFPLLHARLGARPYGKLSAPKAPRRTIQQFMSRLDEQPIPRTDNRTRSERKRSDRDRDRGVKMRGPSLSPMDNPSPGISDADLENILSQMGIADTGLRRRGFVSAPSFKFTECVPADEKRTWRDYDPAHLPTLPKRNIVVTGAAHDPVFEASLSGGKAIPTYARQTMLVRLIPQEWVARGGASVHPFPESKKERPSVRFLVIAGKAAVSKVAVERKRVRSRFKAALDFVLNRSNAPPPIAQNSVYFVILRAPVYALPWEELCAEIEGCLRYLSKQSPEKRDGGRYGSRDARRYGDRPGVGRYKGGTW